jgi:DNA-directed RNA polymerase specialized sigma24 family protein
MPAILMKTKRENLLQEIFGVLRQWPQLDRRVFSQAHYHGQSAEAISRALQLEVEEVQQILKQCDRRLYDSLKNFRNGGCEQHPLIVSQPACPAA